LKITKCCKTFCVVCNQHVACVTSLNFLLARTVARGVALLKNYNRRAPLKACLAKKAAPRQRVFDPPWQRAPFLIFVRSQGGDFFL
jgi:hypothetical protein